MEGIRVKSILKDLLNTEKEAEKTIQKLEKQASEIVDKSKQEVEHILEEEKNNLSQERKKQFDKANKQIASLVQNIETHGQAQINELVKLSASVEKKAKERITQILLEK